MFKHLILAFGLLIRLQMKSDIQTSLNARMITYRKSERIREYKFSVAHDFIWHAEM